MIFGAITARLYAPATDFSAHPLQPQSSPREFDAQDGQADGYDDQGRSGQNDQCDANRQHGTTDHGYRYAACDLVGSIRCLNHHFSSLHHQIHLFFDNHAVVFVACVAHLFPLQS